MQIKKFFPVILSVLMIIISCMTGCNNNESEKSKMPSTVTNSDNKNPEWSIVDFTVEIENGKEPVVLQLTDPQVMDSENLQQKCFDYITETINSSRPDLILITGDVVYGKFNSNGTLLRRFIQFMEGFDIPWAPIMGNHDGETPMGVDAMCQQYEKAENCLFKQRSLTGNGNYTVGLKQDGKLKRVYFMMDSNGYSAMSDATASNKHSTEIVGLAKDQIEWLKETVQNIIEKSSNTKFSLAIHIQPAIFKDAFSKYGFTNIDTFINTINIDLIKNKINSDFGYIGADLKNVWDEDKAIWNIIKSLGFDSILVGHEHYNSASVVYEGIRCQYGQKSSTYDRYNSLQSNGTIGRDVTDMPLVGGTVMVLSSHDAAEKYSYIYLCNNTSKLIK